MNNISKLLVTLVVVLLIILSTVLLFSNFDKKESTDTAFIMPQQVFKEFKGTIEVEQKFVKLQQKQKYLLDSMLAEIKMGDPLNNKVSKEILRKKEIYNKILSQFEESNKVQYQQYSESLWKQINQYIADYGKENHYQYIYGADGRGNLMYADSSKNITKNLVEYINLKYAGH